MKIKTNDLNGKALNWAAAVAAGRLDTTVQDPDYPGMSIIDIGFDEDGVLMVYEGKRRYNVWLPSEIWSQAGPIIERERIVLGPDGVTGWRAQLLWDASHVWHGSAPLVAAMRCFVASKLGDEVEPPEWLS